METAIRLADLPWTTTLMFATGYAGYFVAHIGVRSHHTTADVTFGTFMFGFWGLFSYFYLLSKFSISTLPASAFAMLITIILGIVWSCFGRRIFSAFITALPLSKMDDLPSAWAALSRSPHTVSYQLTVKTVDGAAYHCNSLHDYSKLPDGPCTFGGNGDLLMYVTHYKPPLKDDYIENTSLQDPEWGAEITYIPKERIALLDILRK